MEEEEEIGSKWRDRERLLFSCANYEVCRAMKCELVRSCCALEQKSTVVLESILCFRGGWGLERMGSTDTRTEQGENLMTKILAASICRNALCRASLVKVHTNFTEVFLPKFQ